MLGIRCPLKGWTQLSLFGANIGYNLPRRSGSRAAHSVLAQGGHVEFVMFEDVDGMEVFVNPDKVIWIREYPNHTTVISCGHEDKFTVRLAPAHAVAALGKAIR